MVSDPGLARYLSQLARTPLLALDEEATADRETLILSNLRLVVHIARTYSRSVDELLERIQDGNVGLCRAADAFDPSRGRFSVCASFYIRAAIRERRVDGFGKPLRRRSSSDEELISLDGVDAPASDDPATEVQEHQDLQAMARLISPKQRAVIGLRLLGNTQQEVAELIGTSYQNVQQLERNALKAIGDRHELS